ncbi:MAG: transglutaminase domain-containing protein [Candidatus Neomarinimicrobiota bacterium]|nr:MAG: transglutaminase domain-containing protein [Candidatus Neomarinimicrobiota bacterium]
MSPSDSTRFRFRSAGWRDRPPVPEDEAGNAFIQSQRPEIRKLARSLVTQPADSLRAARELLRFVYSTLEKVPVANLSTALDILAQKKGDCSEHTTLYASLSRALRIPTRVRIGLVHLQGRFLYHAWPVVYSQGQWWDVDPTLNQFPADATHIPLLEGDPTQLSGLLPGLGRLSITLLDYETSHVAN